MSDYDIQILASRTRGFSGRDIENMFDQAGEKITVDGLMEA